MKDQAAEIFVAQPLLAVRLLLQSTKAHSQEWLCYPPAAKADFFLSFALRLEAVACKL
jgi:hypothetical protein